MIDEDVKVKKKEKKLVRDRLELMWQTYPDNSISPPHMNIFLSGKKQRPNFYLSGG